MSDSEAPEMETMNDPDEDADAPETGLETEGEGEPEPEPEPAMEKEMPPDETQEANPLEEVPAGEGGGSIVDFITGGGIKQMLMRPQYQDSNTGHTYSQADLIADVINVMRMDAKQIAALHGIDIPVNKMTPTRAAELMENVATEGGIDIIAVFQEIEDKNDHTLRHLFTDDQHEQYMDYKKNMLYSVPNNAEWPTDHEEGEE